NINSIRRNHDFSGGLRWFLTENAPNSMGSSSRRSVPKGNQIPKLSPSSSSFPAAAATKGTTASH
ncbi:hypothetical protein Lal_00012461, partial [Lupinus albus]